MAFELSVTLKNEDGSRTYKHKDLVYDPIILNHPTDYDISLKPYVENAIKEWGGEKPDSIRVRINLEYQDNLQIPLPQEIVPH